MVLIQKHAEADNLIYREQISHFGYCRAFEEQQVNVWVSLIAKFSYIKFIKLKKKYKHEIWKYVYLLGNLRSKHYTCTLQTTLN